MRISPVIEVKGFGAGAMERALRQLRKESGPILRELKLKEFHRTRTQRRRYKDWRAAEKLKKRLLLHPPRRD